MRHRVGARKLGLPTDQRKAMLRNLVSSLLWHDEIDTTEARAKEASRLADKVITLAKQNTLHARRQVHALIFEQNIPFQGQSDKSHRDHRNPHRLLRRVFEEIGPLYRDTRGGYTRIIRLGARRGDGAMVVRLELTKGISVGQSRSTRRSDRRTPAPASSGRATGAQGSASPTTTEPAASAPAPEQTPADTPVTDTTAEVTPPSPVENTTDQQTE